MRGSTGITRLSSMATCSWADRWRWRVAEAAESAEAVVGADGGVDLLGIASGAQEIAVSTDRLVP